MDDGRIQMDGTPKEVFPQVEKLHSLGLDTPQSTELAYLLRKEGFDIDGVVLTAEDCVEEIIKLWKSKVSADDKA